MSNKLTPKRYPIPAQYPPKDHFDYIGHRNMAEVEKYPALAKRDYWKDWCQAYYYAGNTLYLWNEATEVKRSFISSCSIKEGQSVFIIAKYADESGVAAALKSLIGPVGSMKIQEIWQLAIESVCNPDKNPGTKLQWDFHYLDSVAGKSLDRVILFSAASHVANWAHFAEQINRVLKDDGRLIIAETPLGGREFNYAAHMDSHDEGYVMRVLSGLGIKEEELPGTGTDDLSAVFTQYLQWQKSFNWQGVYLFYGQKGGNGETSTIQFPKVTREVELFLTQKPSKNSWDYLSEAEKAVWIERATDINTHKGSRLWGTANLMWAWCNHRDITDAMYSNLMLEPSDKIMIITESMGPEDLGIRAEIEKRTGGNVEIEWVIMSQGGYDYNNWQKKRADYIARDCGEEWPYDFADHFPDNYFDLIFLPQGVHHSNNWLRDAPRLLKKLKPGRQIICCECGVMRPEHVAAHEMSALERLVSDRVWDFVFHPWQNFKLNPRFHVSPTPQTEHVGRPYHDVSTAHLREAFGDSLTDVYSLEKHGFILFWGYKK
jgi:SAM-dependent methyltransferase